MNLAGKIIAGTFAVVALFLVLTNPNGDKTLLGSGSSAYDSAVKSLEGR